MSSIQTINNRKSQLYLPYKLAHARDETGHENCLE